MVYLFIYLPDPFSILFTEGAGLGDYIRISCMAIALRQWTRPVCRRPEAL